MTTPDDTTHIRASKAVVRRLKVAALMMGKPQPEALDELLTQAMDKRKIPVPDSMATTHRPTDESIIP